MGHERDVGEKENNRMGNIRLCVFNRYVFELTYALLRQAGLDNHQRSVEDPSDRLRSALGVSVPIFRVFNHEE